MMENSSLRAMLIDISCNLWRLQLHTHPSSLFHPTPTMAYSTPSPPTFPQKAYKGSINDNHFTASTSNLASSVVANTLRTRNKTDQYVAIPCSECGTVRPTCDCNNKATNWAASRPSRPTSLHSTATSASSAPSDPWADEYGVVRAGERPWWQKAACCVVQ